MPDNEIPWGVELAAPKGPITINPLQITYVEALVVRDGGPQTNIHFVGGRMAQVMESRRTVLERLAAWYSRRPDADAVLRLLQAFGIEKEASTDGEVHGEVEGGEIPGGAGPQPGEPQTPEGS